MKAGVLRGLPSVNRIIHKAGDCGAILISGLVLTHFVNIDETTLQVAEIGVVICCLLAISLFNPLGMYQHWRGETKAKEFYATSVAWVTVYVLSAFILFILDYNSKNLQKFYYFWFLWGGGSLLFSRLIIRMLLNQTRAAGHNLRSIIIIGSNNHSAEVIKRLKQESWTGFRVVGYFGDNEIADLLESKLGTIDQVEEYLNKNSEYIDQAWITIPLSDEANIHKLLEQLNLATVDIRYVPNIFAFRLINHSISEVAQMPIINISTSPMNGWNRFIKAAEDKLISGLILLMISPLMLMLAVGVKLSSPGPVFYRQERVSLNGRRFMMLKFRSMPVDSEKNGIQWGGARTKTTTRFGQFIRKTSLDELPQFINVLTGDMSIVGPRPERTVFVEQFKYEIPGYMQKHMMKAGITGWAQINGWRGDTDLQERVNCDIHYISNWSFGLDIKIIFLTIFKGFLNKNAI